MIIVQLIYWTHFVFPYDVSQFKLDIICYIHAYNYLYAKYPELNIKRSINEGIHCLRMVQESK